MDGVLFMGDKSFGEWEMSVTPFTPIRKWTMKMHKGIKFTTCEKKKNSIKKCLLVEQWVSMAGVLT